MGRVIGASKIARDVTAEKRAEKQRARLYEAAQREIANRERADRRCAKRTRGRITFLRRWLMSFAIPLRRFARPH